MSLDGHFDGNAAIGRAVRIHRLHAMPVGARGNGLAVGGGVRAHGRDDTQSPLALVLRSILKLVSSNAAIVRVTDVGIRDMREIGHGQ